MKQKRLRDKIIGHLQAATGFIVPDQRYWDGVALGMVDYIEESSLSPIPVGVMLEFAGRELPAGFLFCNGKEIDRKYYAKLFGVIGTMYGEGNGATSFNLPDKQSRQGGGFFIIKC